MEILNSPTNDITTSKARRSFFKVENVPHLLDILAILAVEVVVFSKFDLSSLFTATITTGGDTASHYYTLEYLRHTLLPAGKISGWNLGNYAGFPILQFYFPLPFLIMCLLDLFMPLQVAFKLVTLFGTALLPVCAYSMLRLIRCPFPGPGIGAAFMLPFLFNSSNSMWGGNILSTLAGEFSYSLSLALSLLLVGSLYRGALEEKWVIRNAFLVFLVGFSHGYTLLFAEAISLFLLITPYGFTRRMVYLFKVYALGFCLLAFWLVPLLAYTQHTTSYHLVWTIHSIKEVAPEILLPVIVTGIGGSLILFVAVIFRYRDNSLFFFNGLAYLWFGLAVAVVFFVAAPRIGVVDIRYVPYGQLMVCLMAAFFFGWAARYVLKPKSLNWMLLIVATAGIMQWAEGHVGPVTEWSKWNYEGFEAKKTWTVFDQINKELEGSFQDPRVVYEHSQDHNMFGSSRAFESLPLFAGRATLEGLYMQASTSAPFVFYIQSLVSQQSSQPFPQYSYSTMDFKRARRSLTTFNVSDLIIKSREAKEAIRRVKEYTKTKSIGQYELWHLTTSTGRYIDVLPAEPVVYQGSDPWKQVAYQWFTRDDLGNVHLVFNEASENSDGPLKLSTGSLDIIPRQEINTSDCALLETIRDDEIFLETTCPGKPHIIKVSYHPNWQVEGAEKIYLVSPAFMLIYPQAEKVQLVYNHGAWDRLGQLLTLFGVAIVLISILLLGKATSSRWSVIANRIHLSAIMDVRILPDPRPGARKKIMLAILIVSVMLIATVSYRTYVNEPYRVYNRSIQHKDDGQFEKARTGFQRFIERYPLSSLAQESSYYIAITYYLEKRDNEALRAFENFLELYPAGNRVAEVQYHIGLILMRSNQKQEGRRRMLQLIENHPDTPWAGYAKERLQEQHDIPMKEHLDNNSREEATIEPIR
jgi:tetratricopeptide (TPR) repeat protein